MKDQIKKINKNNELHNKKICEMKKSSFCHVDMSNHILIIVIIITE